MVNGIKYGWLLLFVCVVMKVNGLQENSRSHIKASDSRKGNNSVQPQTKAPIIQADRVVQDSIPKMLPRSTSGDKAILIPE